MFQMVVFRKFFFFWFQNTKIKSKWVQVLDYFLIFINFYHIIWTFKSRLSKNRDKYSFGVRIQNQESIWEERCHNCPQLQKRCYQIHRKMFPIFEKKAWEATECNGWLKMNEICAWYKEVLDIYRIGETKTP